MAEEKLCPFRKRTAFTNSYDTCYSTMQNAYAMKEQFCACVSNCMAYDNGSCLMIKAKQQEN